MKTVGLTFETAVHDELTVDDISFDNMTVAQLKQFAKDNGIDIGSAAKKDELIQVIVGAGEPEV